MPLSRRKSSKWIFTTVRLNLICKQMLTEWSLKCLKFQFQTQPLNVAPFTSIVHNWCCSFSVFTFAFLWLSVTMFQLQQKWLSSGLLSNNNSNVNNRHLEHKFPSEHVVMWEFALSKHKSNMEVTWFVWIYFECNVLGAISFEVETNRVFMEKVNACNLHVFNIHKRFDWNFIFVVVWTYFNWVEQDQRRQLHGNHYKICTMIVFQWISRRFRASRKHLFRQARANAISCAVPYARLFRH